MKFRMFTNENGEEVAVNVDAIEQARVYMPCIGKNSVIYFRSGEKLVVKEDFRTVFSRLNTVAE